MLYENCYASTLGGHKNYAESRYDTLTLRVSYSQWLCNSGGYEKNNDRRSSVSPINDFGQQRLNSAAAWSASEGAKFCHASNILLVGRQRRHALSRLCLIPLRSVGCWSSVGHRSFHNKGCRAIGGFPPKEKVIFCATLQCFNNLCANDTNTNSHVGPLPLHPPTSQCLELYLFSKISMLK